MLARAEVRGPAAWGTCAAAPAAVGGGGRVPTSSRRVVLSFLLSNRTIEEKRAGG